MDAEIHDTAAAGLLPVVEPALVGPVGVVEGQIHGEHLAELAASRQRATSSGTPATRAVAEVDRDQPVEAPGRPRPPRAASAIVVASGFWQNTANPRVSAMMA